MTIIDRLTHGSDMGSLWNRQQSKWQQYY